MRLRAIQILEVIGLIILSPAYLVGESCHHFSHWMWNDARRGPAMHYQSWRWRRYRLKMRSAFLASSIGFALQAPTLWIDRRVLAREEE